jgi:NAD(P)-dependent dehydrogenase (short-subunit alcohol dehydrogenase family)
VRRLQATGATEPDVRPALSAVTALGGALGHWNARSGLPEGGGILGLCKGLRREFPELRVKVLDTEPGESPHDIVRALLAELDSQDPRAEVGLLRGRRHVLRLVPVPARLDPRRLEELRALPYVLLTGGARGITAEIALRLAQAGVRRLHLLGTTPLPAMVQQWRELDAAGLERLRQEILVRLRDERGSVTPVEWERACEPIDKALEIDRNLRRLVAAGARADYHAVDVADARRLAEVLDAIRASDGPVHAMIHGAGWQHSRGFVTKSAAEVTATLAPKLDGTLNLLQLTAHDPVQLVVGFGSVSGRFGGLGQADYSLACEMLARLTGAWAAAHPGCRALTISWPAWGEVGMAMHKKTRHILESKHRMFMGVEEGCDHFLREVLAADPEPEVTIGAELPVLDLDRQLPRPKELTCLRARVELSSRLPLADAVLAAGEKRVLVECRVDADRDPFLTQHRHGHTAILPAVMSLELLAETAQLARPGERLAALEGVSIGAGIKLAETRRLSLRCEVEVAGDVADLKLRAHHVGRQAHLLELDRVFVVGRARWGTSRLESSLQRIAPPAEVTPVSYASDLPGSLAPAGWYHGPDLRTLLEVSVGPGSLHWGRVCALPATALRPWRPEARWWIPAPALDGCLSVCVNVVRTKLRADGLPIGFGRLLVARAPEPGEICDAVVRERGHDERRVHFDFTLFGCDGDPILVAEDYVLHTFLPIGSSLDAPDARRREATRSGS